MEIQIPTTPTRKPQTKSTTMKMYIMYYFTEMMDTLEQMVLDMNEDLIDEVVVQAQLELIYAYYKKIHEMFVQQRNHGQLTEAEYVFWTNDYKMTTLHTIAIYQDYIDTHHLDLNACVHDILCALATN